MPDWSGIRDQVLKLSDHSGYSVGLACYAVRQAYLRKLNETTKRDTIVYGANWVWSKVHSRNADTQITDEDVYGFMAVMGGLKSKKLDLILHTPGGMPNAAEAILKYLRQKFHHIRVIIPFAAMSSGTVIACGADEIVMGKHSFIGPTDPQMFVRHPYGTYYLPAHSLVNDFRRAEKSFFDNEFLLGAWAPIIEQYPKGLISECIDAMALSDELVRDWLERYMLNPEKPDLEEAEEDTTPAKSKDSGTKNAGRIKEKKASKTPAEVSGKSEHGNQTSKVADDDDTDTANKANDLTPERLKELKEEAAKKAKDISEWLSNHETFRTHGRYISRDEAKDKGLIVKELEEDDLLQDLVLSIFHSMMLSFGQMENHPKIIENHLGALFFAPEGS